MHTTTLGFSNALNPRRLAIVLGAGLLALTTAAAGRAYLDLQDSAADRLVEMSASYKAAPDLATLKADSDLVVVGRIAKTGVTQMIHETGNNSNITAPAPAPVTVDGKKANAEKLQPPVPDVAPKSPVANANLGTPVTTFSVLVERAIKGSAPAQISVTQLGGKVTLDTYPGGPKLQRTVEFEGDTLMQPGERHVLFLKRANDGTFFVGSGPQGRLSIDQAGNIHAIDANAPALKAHDGAKLESFLNAVDSAK